MFEFVLKYRLGKFRGNILCLLNRVVGIQGFEGTIRLDHHEYMVHGSFELLKLIRTQMKILFELFKHDLDSPSQAVRNADFSRRKLFANTCKNDCLTTTARNYYCGFANF